MTKILTNIYYRPGDEQANWLGKNASLYITSNPGNLKADTTLPAFKRPNFFETDFNDNIAYLNPKLNELTLWWLMWHHPEMYDGAENIGFNHYRRLFTPDQVADFEKLGADAMVIDPIPMKFNLSALTGDPKPNIVDTTIEKGYSICHIVYDWQKLEALVKKTWMGKYWDDWKEQSALNAPCNMFVMKHHLFKEYCELAFPILLELEKQVNVEAYDNYQKRQCAFLAERLFSLYMYIKREQGFNICEATPMYKPSWKPDTATDKRGMY